MSSRAGQRGTVRARPLSVITVLIVAGVLASPSQAEPLPNQFTLGRYIPGDVWMYVHTVHNPQRAWLEQEWGEFFAELETSGVDSDIAMLLLTELADGDTEPIKAILSRIREVRWRDLWGREMVVAKRVTTGPANSGHFFLFRGNSGTGEENAAALLAVFKAIAAQGDGITFVQRRLLGVECSSLQFEPRYDLSLGSIELFRKGDVIGLTTSADAAREVVALMTGKSKSTSIVETKRFKEALGQVKQPRDEISFFDIKRLAGSLTGLMDRVGSGRGDAVAAFKKAIDICDVMDFAVSTRETIGQREWTHSVWRLQPEKRNSAMACCLLDRKSFQRFDRYIPADATSFFLSGTVDLGHMYGVVTDFVEKAWPDLMPKWTGLLESVGLDLERDLFSWWSGEVISICLPPQTHAMQGGSDTVLMIRVKDPKLAAQKIDAALDFVGGLFRARGQLLMIRPAPVVEPGFREVSHPFVMMMAMRPVIGVRDEWLMIGTTPEAVTRCLNVAAGRAPSIATNKRFLAEGIKPTGPVLSASFKDTSNFGEEWGTAVTMFSMFGRMSAMSTHARNAEDAQARKAVSKALTLVGKLGPVLRKLDFYSSESSVTTYDGRVTLRTEKVITYKPHESAEGKSAEAK